MDGKPHVQFHVTLFKNILMNLFFYLGEDPERGKEQQGQPDPQGTCLFLFIFFSI